jgi:hypothetical protein
VDATRSSADDVSARPYKWVVLRYNSNVFPGVSKAKGQPVEVFCLSLVLEMNF